MNPKDEAILSILSHGQWMSPKDIHRNLKTESVEIHYNTVLNRLQSLRLEGLVEKDGDDAFYRATAEGRDRA